MIRRDLADQAQSLIGLPYRRGGQCAAQGFDCVGMVRHCLIAVGCSVPVLPPYSLRNTHQSPFIELAMKAGLVLSDEPAEAGDICVFQPSCAQHHLAVIGPEGGAIHAHAGLRRVALSPMPLPWTLKAIWRLEQ